MINDESIESDYPDIDLKGHTIEELAAFANVTVDVIKAALKIRKEQMKSTQRNSLTKRKTALSSDIPASLSTATKKTTQHFIPPTLPHTTPKKKVSKYIYTKGHKVISINCPINK